MGRKIKDNSNKAAKNRARVKKSRQLKNMKSAHEIHIREKVYSMNQQRFEKICDNIDKESSDSEASNSLPYDDVDKTVDFMDKLRYWVVHHRITHSALNDLLKILIFGGFVFLPKDSRTLMKTPAKVEIVAVTNGKLWYYGIKKCLEKVLTKISCDSSITLDFSFDGLPIFNSSNMQFWPMLFSIQGIFQTYDHSH